MTINEANIARLMASVITDALGCTPGHYNQSEELLEAFIRYYRPERVCAYTIECVMAGTCKCGKQS